MEKRKSSISSLASGVRENTVLSLSLCDLGRERLRLWMDLR